MAKRKTHGLRRVRSRKLRGRTAHALHKSTKGGSGPIKKRRGYKRAMKK